MGRIGIRDWDWILMRNVEADDHIVMVDVKISYFLIMVLVWSYLCHISLEFSSSHLVVWCRIISYLYSSCHLGGVVIVISPDLYGCLLYHTVGYVVMIANGFYHGIVFFIAFI